MKAQEACFCALLLPVTALAMVVVHIHELGTLLAAVALFDMISY